jgi:hypothetical protein
MHRNKANFVRFRLARPSYSPQMAKDGESGPKFQLALRAFNAVKRSPTVNSLPATKACVEFADRARQARRSAILAEHHYSSSRSLFTAA